MFERTFRSVPPVLQLATCSLLVAAGCKSPELPATTSQARFIVRSAEGVSQVAGLMRAAIDMQHNGEPLAETMGRKLAGYDRTARRPDQYADPDSKMTTTDLAGYSSAVESYEYSKVIMNYVGFESGAGLSLMYGPLLNAAGQSGDAAVGLLRSRVQALAMASHAGVDANGPWVIVPAPVGNALNLLGFPGLMPQFAELSTFDTSIEPSGNVLRNCSLAAGYGAAAGMNSTVGDYECGYNSLHIARDRATKVLAPDALGFAAWKQALWVINYLQLVHDPAGEQRTHVADADSAMVGKVGNTVKADNGDVSTAAGAGTYIGASDLEGFQALLMTEQIDNKAELLLKKLTSNGSGLGGFASVSAALGYDWNSALRFFPSQVAVTETAGTGSADAQPTAYSVMTSESTLAGLSALIGAYSEAFALTDLRNGDVGGSSTVRPVFDGDPFAGDNGMADGESTLHDRSLAVLKVALVNLDRLHVDPATGVLCDRAAVAAGGSVTRTRRVTTVELSTAISALRTAYRSLSAQLTLYSDATPDTLGTTTALDTTSTAGIPGGVALATRLQQIIKTQADFLNQRLLDGAGLASNGYDIAANAADGAAPRVEAQAAAVRGLLDAYLATGQVSYRDRAQAAYDVLESRYYNGALRVYRTTPGADDSYTWTPERFAAVQSALARMYVLIAARPGMDSLRAQLESRLGRLNKLVLNGWDDANDDGQVDYPGECLTHPAGLASGLMLAERALTGELGSDQGALTADRDHDCVMEIDDAKRAAVLAGAWTIAPAAAMGMTSAVTAGAGR